MPTHPVALKLQQSILPYVVSGELLRRQSWYRTYGLYTYCHEALVALAGLGFSTPLLRALTGVSEGGGGAAAATALGVPPWLTPAAAVGLVVWILLKIFINREDVAKRATLARSCRREMRTHAAKVLEELVKVDPMPGLLELQKKISDLVDRNIREDAWPWAGPADNIDAVVQGRLDQLRARYESNWRPVSAVEQA